MKRKYLDDIGATYRPDTWLSDDDERHTRLAEQRKIYGFDERETWSLDSAFYFWLYERLMMFKELAGKMVNLNFHTFEYCGKEYTQLQLIDMMLERLKYSFDSKYDDLNEKEWNYVHEIEDIWAVILPVMWW